MKFIYSLMLITFLMTTFAPVMGWGSADTDAAYNKCISDAVAVATKTKTNLNEAQIKKCVQLKGVLLQNSGSAVTAFHEDNNCYIQTRKTSSYSVNSNKFREQVMACENKSKPSAPPKSTAAKPPATTKAVSETQQASASASNTFHCNDSANYKSGSCYCNTGEKKETVSGNSLNATVSKCVENAVATKQPAPQPEYESDGSNCLVVYQKLVATCKQDAQTAVIKCDLSSEENKSNSDFAGLGDLLKGASAMAVKSKSGSGAYESCLNTALTTQAGFFATEELNTSSCDPAVKQCKTSCEVVKNEIEGNKEAVVNNCVDLAMNQHISENGQFDDQAEKSRFVKINTITFQQALDQIVTELEAGQSDCDVDAVSLQDKLKQASNDFNNAAKQAQVCRCQTGSTGEDCNAIKGPAQCVLNPNAPGCALSTVNCNNSNSIQCRCLKNPNLAECKTGGGGRESGLVGKPFSTPSSSIGSGAAPKINNGDLDISFADEALNAGASGTEGSATSPFGSAQASGGGGGGAGGGGAGTGEEDPTKTADGEGGLKPLLDKPKGFIAGVLNKLGFGPNPTDKNYKTDANGKKIDPNKWKPGMIRGVAGDGSEIGPKHRDIWKAMNSQYFLQEKTFINGK